MPHRLIGESDQTSDFGMTALGILVQQDNNPSPLPEPPLSRPTTNDLPGLLNELRGKLRLKMGLWPWQPVEKPSDGPGQDIG